MAWSDAARVAAARMRQLRKAGLSWRTPRKESRYETGLGSTIRLATQAANKNNRKYVVYKRHDGIFTYAGSGSKEYKPKQVRFKVTPRKR